MSSEQSAERRRPETGSEPEAEDAMGPNAEPDSEGAGEETGAEPESGAAPDETDRAAGDDQAAVETAEQPESGSDVAEPPEALEAEIARLNEELSTVRARSDDYWQRLVRSEAEKENIRKRAQKDVDSARQQALEKFANELLGVRDSLELGLDAAHEEEADVAKIREGTELTLKMLTQAMEKFQIERIDPAGERFDPELHQAMSMQEVEDQSSNTVVSVMQKGYRMGDRLLRPALVMVAK